MGKHMNFPTSISGGGEGVEVGVIPSPPPHLYRGVGCGGVTSKRGGGGKSAQCHFSESGNRP